MRVLVLLVLVSCTAAPARAQDDIDIRVNRPLGEYDASRDPRIRRELRRELEHRERERAIAHCRAGRMQRCMRAGGLVLPWLERACREGRADACVALAEMYTTGQAGMRSPRRAARWRAEACRIEPAYCEPAAPARRDR
jgi:hypothetical protein